MPCDKLDEREGGFVTMRLIVGLGNPGGEYVGTRHNVGFEVIERLAERHRIPVRRRTLRAVLGDGIIEEQKVLLAKPMTYMNLSGEAVGAISRMYRVPPGDIIVLVDDIALPLGKLRLRLKGSAGGHNGLDSIEHHLRTQDYPRIRIGVGAAFPGRMVDHVLSRFRPDEREIIAEAVQRAADAVETALREGFEKAMDQYNRE
jgi:PTH1 family peptidyl-tRNA hydrolase